MKILDHIIIIIFFLTGRPVIWDVTVIINVINVIIIIIIIF